MFFTRNHFKMTFLVYIAFFFVISVRCETYVAYVCSIPENPVGGWARGDEDDGALLRVYPHTMAVIRRIIAIQVSPVQIHELQFAI